MSEVRSCLERQGEPRGAPLREGPGPMPAALPSADEVPLGSAWIDFHHAHDILSIVANDATTEAQVRARLDAWALQHVGELLRRLARELPVPAACGEGCRCQEATR